MKAVVPTTIDPENKVLTRLKRELAFVSGFRPTVEEGIPLVEQQIQQ